jgi:hypothetical protein
VTADRPDPRLDGERAALAAALETMRTQPGEAFPGALGHAAMLAVIVAVRAWMGGLADTAAAVLREQREWLRRSLAEGESFGAAPLLTAAQVADALALTTWLLDNRDDPDERHDAIARYERYLAVVRAADPDEAPDSETELDIERLRASDHAPPLPVDLVRAEQLLARHGRDWLDDGNAIRLAGWLKLRYWDTGLALTPDQTLHHRP